MYIPFNLSLIAYFLRSPGANQRPLSHLVNDSLACFLSTLKGNTERGFIFVVILAFFNTNAVPQNAHSSAVTLGFSVDSAPQPVHLTVKS